MLLVRKMLKRLNEIVFYVVDIRQEKSESKDTTLRYPRTEELQDIKNVCLIYY